MKSAKGIVRSKPMPKSWASNAAAEYPPLEQVEGDDPSRDAHEDGAGSVYGQHVELPGGGGDAGLEDPLGRGDSIHDSETNDQVEEDGRDFEGQDYTPSQTFLTGMGLDAEVPEVQYHPEEILRLFIFRNV